MVAPNSGIFYNLNASSSPEIAFFGANFTKKFLFLKSTGGKW